MKIKAFIASTIVSCILSSCATAPVITEPQRRYTWPRGSSDPKIEWIGVFGSSKQLKKDDKSLLTKFIGEENAISLDKPIGIASNAKGTVVVTDIGKGSVLEFDFPGRDVHRFAGDNLAGVIQRPLGIAVDDKDNFYVADDYSRRLYVVGPDKKVSKIINVSQHVGGIGFFAIDKKRGRIVLPDPVNHKIVVTDLNGEVLFSFGKLGVSNAEFNRPNAVAVASDGTIVVADSFNSRIQLFSSDGTFKKKFGKRGDAQGDFALIKGVAIDSEDHIYITDGRLNRITIFSMEGEGLMTFGDSRAETYTGAFAIGGFLIPQAIYIDSNDTIFIVDQYNNRFQVYQYLSKSYLQAYPLSGPMRTMFWNDKK